MNKAELFWQTYLNLERELLELSKYIYVTDEKMVYAKDSVKRENCPAQLNVFSPYIADLIVRTCIEIEAISKELYFVLGEIKKRGDKDLFFDDDCLKLLDIKCKSSAKVVLVSCPFFNLTEDSNKILKPLKEAHKRQGTDWERAYQAIKHDRYSSISHGTIKNYMHALAALFLLNIYYKNSVVYAKYLEIYKLDFSFGSKVFSLKKPSDKYVVDVVNGKEVKDPLISEDTPYVLKYTDSEYKQVLEAHKKFMKDRLEYMCAQPEFMEAAFVQHLNALKEIEKRDPRQNVVISWELCKYRLNKKIPQSLPFEERKRLFVGSDEFYGNTRMRNHHKSEDELTEENLQSEIDSAGMFAGMELERRFENLKNIKAFAEGYCELVVDRGNVRYS